MSHRLFQKISLKADSCLLFWNQQTDKHQLSPCHSHLWRGNNHFHTIIIIHARIEVPVGETELTNNSDTCKNPVKCSSWFGLFSFPFLLLLYYLSCLLRTSGVFGIDVNFEENYRLVASSKVYRNLETIFIWVFFIQSLAYISIQDKQTFKYQLCCEYLFVISFFLYLHPRFERPRARGGVAHSLPITWFARHLVTSSPS